jgi:hypothetical protein
MAQYKDDIYIKINSEKEETLSQNYIRFIKEAEIDLSINLFHVTSAYGLNHYFINQKLILSGFPKAGEIVEVSETIKEKQKRKPVDSLERKILLFPGKVVLLSQCSASHICGALEFNIACKELTKQKLGVLGNVKVKPNAKANICFTKLNPNSPEFKSMEITNRLLDIFIDEDDYIKSYDDTCKSK